MKQVNRKQSFFFLTDGGTGTGNKRLLLVCITHDVLLGDPVLVRNVSVIAKRSSVKNQPVVCLCILQRFWLELPHH